MPNFPNRCQHLKVNGTQCGSPALRRNRFCYFHKLHQEQRITLGTDQARRNRNLTITLPVLEDANSIQVTLMQVMRLIIAGQIAAKQAGLLLYALQTASSNLARTSFEPYRHDIVLDPKTVNQTALGSHVWEDEDFPEYLEDDEEEANDEAADPDDPRPDFTPRTPQEARNKAEMSRWSEAEADRLQALGKLQREAERQAELREDRIEAERQQAEEEAIEAVARQNASRSAAAAPAVTPAGRAILPPQLPAKHPPAKATIGEVREKVNAQIRKALPAIAAAVRQNSGRSG